MGVGGWEGPMWLHRACERKIGDIAGRALDLTLKSPEAVAQGGLCSQEGDTWLLCMGKLGKGE